MRLIRLCLTCMLLCLLTPWAGAAVLSATPPCHAHQAAAQVVHTDHNEAARTVDALADDIEQANTPADGRHLPCGDCAACHGVALAPAVSALRGPTDVHGAPRWTPSLSDGRWLGCELYRPPRP